MEKLDPSAAVQITHIKCRQCGEDMPSKADRCPHCGKVTKRIRVHQVLFVVGALILLVLLGVGYFMK
jgi:tRNA(Ile2) C34 agmatinyltransferase TiaS